MQFRTELQLPASANKISLGHRFLTLGSCFAEVIGRRLSENKLDTLNNPFGTIFNPISQFELVQAALAPEEQEELPLVQQNGYWYAYNFHSSFAAESKAELQQQIDFALSLTREQIEKADTLVFTFGTALVYQLAVSDRILANCHKMPQSNFSKRLLLSEEIVAGFTEMFALVKQVNPRVRVILTVSPVRHLKETLVLNSVSKAVLRVACHYLAEMLPDVDYFPAFELLVDDLRDYRFYKDDMLHPTEMAEQYVWEKFAETYFDQPLQRFTHDWSRIRQGLAHRPFQPDSEGHQQFLHGLLEQLQKLSATVNVKAETEQVKRQLMPVRRNKAARKAPRELVSLLETLAASEVMAEEDFASRKPRTELASGADEPFVWPDQEEEEAAAPAPEAPAEKEAGPTTPEPAQPEQQQAPETEAVQPNAQPQHPESKREIRKSKSKKRRDKRKAKMLAARNQAVGQEQATASAPEQTAAPAQAAAPETNAKAAGTAPPAAPAAPQEPAGQTEQPSGAAAAIEPETAAAPKTGRQARPVKPARNKRGKTVPAPEAQAPEPAAQAPEVPAMPAPEPQPEAPAAPAPARKKPGRKPAAAVGALLSALAQAQAPPPTLEPVKKTKPARAGRKPAPAPAPDLVAPVAALKPETPAPQTRAEEQGPEAAPAAPQKPARAKRAPRKPKNTAPELPFTPANQPENAPAPAPEPAAPAAPEPAAPEPAAPGPAKAAKEPKARKEAGAAPRKGKARKVTIKKTPAGKNGNG